MPGKLLPDALRDNVLKFCGSRRNDVLVGGGLGEDAAIISIPEGLLAVASDPITGAEKGAGSLLVHVNANDLACKGAVPSWLIVTLIVPDNLGKNFIADIMHEIHNTCCDMNIAVIGGHTELTDKYSSPVISGTMFGMTRYNLSAKNIRPDDVIIATGHAGLEGMSIIANDRPDLLAGFFSQNDIALVKSWQNDLSVLRPAEILSPYSHYMHDPTEGGIAGALLETSHASGLGLEISLDNIPVHPLTLKAANLLHFSFINLISSGMLLAVMPQENVHSALQELTHHGIASSIIGRFIHGESNILLDAHEDLWNVI